MADEEDPKRSVDEDDERQPAATRQIRTFGGQPSQQDPQGKGSSENRVDSVKASTRNNGVVQENPTQRTTDERGSEGCKAEFSGNSANKQTSSTQGTNEQLTQAGAFHMIGDQLVEEEEGTGEVDEDDYNERSHNSPPIVEARPVEVESLSEGLPQRRNHVEPAPHNHTETPFLGGPETEISVPDAPRGDRDNQGATHDFDVENVVLDERVPSSHTPIVRASPLTEEDEKQNKFLFSNRRRALPFAVIVVVATVGITLGIVFGIQGGSERNNQESTTNSPTNGDSPTDDDSVGTTKETFVRDVLPDYSRSSLEDAQSDQSLALDWLWNDPNATASLPLFRRVQRFALAASFYAMTVIPYSVDEVSGNAWLSGWDECSWPQNVPESVACHRGRMLILDVSDNPYLAGSIAPEFGLFTDLVMYDFRGCPLHGTIPSTIGLARSLQQFLVENSNLTGAIPSEIGRIEHLREFIALTSKLESTVPTEVGLLSNLLNLNLAGNDLSGETPSELGLLSSSLSVLGLFFNTRLSGTIPSELGSLSVLNFANWANTSITGPIPSEFGRLSNLEELFMASTDLVGTIPTELRRLSKLREIWLHDTRLTGTFPLCNLVEDGVLVAYTVPCTTVQCSCNCNCSLNG